MDPQIHAYMRRYHSTGPSARRVPGRDTARHDVTNVRYPGTRGED
jgi:hypothetical protein